MNFATLLLALSLTEQMKTIEWAATGAISLQRCMEVTGREKGLRDVLDYLDHLRKGNNFL